MQQIFSIAWESIVFFWEWLAAAGVTIATMRGWVWWRGKKESERVGGHAGQLSVVHAVAGPASHELGLMLSEKVKAWRMNNLIGISQKFDKICSEKGLNRGNLHALSIRVGLPMLEQASNEEDDKLQEMWANLMVSAMSEPHEDSGDLYKTWANILSQMSWWDCQLLSVVVEEGISSMGDDGMISNPLSDEDIEQHAQMPSIRVVMHLQKLVSLGLVLRDPTTPLQPGGPIGLQHAYIPTHLGMNMYMNCGNIPKWYEDRGSLPNEQ